MLQPEKMKLIKVEETATRGVYKFAPLPKGYAHTLGNSFRRVLLSSIVGAAPTRIQINGASHEFTTISGIKEDVFNILLNVKAVRLKISSDDFEEVKLTVSKKGLGVVKASDIKMPSGVTIANPDLVICTITDKSAEFEAVIYAKNGYGYTLAEESRKDTKEIGFIYLDSAFSPVNFVNYTVSAARLGKQTDLDELNLELITDGSIMPFEAIKYASAVLRDFYSFIAEDIKVLVEEEEVSEKTESKADAKSEKAKEILIDELNLATRTINALKKHNIKTLNDLAELDEDRLVSIRNLGEKSITEIKKLLKKEGLS